MLRLRVTSDCQPRTKNGQPPHSTTGVASSIWIQFEVCCETSVEAGKVAAHLKRDDRKRQHEADPEPARHVDQLVVGPRLGADEHRLKGHAADRAGARADLPDLGVHRTGVDSPFRALARPSPRHRGIEVAGRIGHELLAAPRRAEIVGLAVVLGPVLGRVRIDEHPAHRVLHPMLALRRQAAFWFTMIDDAVLAA